MSLLDAEKNKLGAAIRNDISPKANRDEYKKKMKIYKLTGDEAEDFNSGLLEDDFVNKIFNEINTGGSVANLFLVPATEFVDEDGTEGVLTVKDAPLRDLSEPDIDSFLPKYIFKGFKETYALNPFPNDKVVYFVMEKEPDTNEFGKVERTRVWLLYNYSPIESENGDYVHQKITLSVFDDNTAKNSQDQYIQVNYFLEPIQPTNAKKIKITPTTLAGIPARPIEVITDQSAQPIIYTVDDTPSLDYWNLDLWMFELFGNNFNIKTAMGAEYYYYQKLFDEFVPGNRVEQNGRFDGLSIQSSSDQISYIIDIGFGGNTTVITSNNVFAEPYRVLYQQKETIPGLGRSGLSDEIISLVSDYKVSGGLNNASQLPIEFHISEETSTNSQTNRSGNTSWKNTSSYNFADIHIFQWQVLGGVLTEPGDAIHMSKPKFNGVYSTDSSDNPINKREFIKAFLEGNASLNGKSFNDATRYPDILVDTFKENIRDIPQDETGWVIHNGGLGDDMTNDIYELDKINWITKQYRFNAETGIGNENIIRLPDPDASLASGIQVEKVNFTSGYRGGFKTEETAIFFDLGEEQTIDQLKINTISGEVIVEYLDADGNPAVGEDRDGNTVVLAPITLKSPQDVVSPTSTALTITYI